MKIHIKLITNILLTSIGLSVLVGSLLKIAGPINQDYKISKKINLVRKSRRSVEKELKDSKSNLSLFYNNKLEKFDKIYELVNKWENLIIKSPDLEVSAFFLSLDNQVYAEIKSDTKLSAASSIKVPILIVLLTMQESKEIFWNLYDSTFE